jgi:hypothetical protein
MKKEKKGNENYSQGINNREVSFPIEPASFVPFAAFGEREDHAPGPYCLP